LNTTIGMKLRWLVPPQELGPITFALNTIMVAAREQPGHISCRLSTDVGPRVALEYVEEWQAEEDLKRQLRSNRFAHIAELIERGMEKPQVEFLVPGGIRGLEYAEEVRGGSA
jgi:quinol monooxygenase YgiN